MSSPPTTLGQYQIIREIARSNDIVYEAYDPMMDRRVALKELMLPSGITDAQKQDRIQRFDREAKAAGRLAHPNIMRVFQVSNDGERHFMSMEFLDGHTLRNEIDTKGFLAVDRAVEIATAVLKGLGHAHANGVVHRDIKPDNIQLLTSGEIKITDFGIARLTFQPNLTMDGQVFGTPSYMSPEQVVGKEIDARSDLFSVGVLLYEMISGHKPFAGDSVVAITYAIMNKEPEPLNQVNHAIWQVISRALDKSPALRFSSAQEMIEALEESANPQSVVLPAPAPPPGQTIYGAAPPMLNPYQPYAQGQQPAPPPIAYPYNPYQHGGGAMPPHSPTYQPPYQPAPIYYPPQPRQPLFKPETKHFLGKLFLTLLVMGTAVAVVLLFVSAIGQAMSRAENQRQDQQLMSRISAEYQNAKEDLQTKAAAIEPLVGRLRSAEYRISESKRLAVLYEQIGQALMARGDFGSLQNAETSFQRANELDSSNPKLMTDLAALYGRSAQMQPALQDRLDGYRESIRWWRAAADAPSATSQEHAQYGEAAARTYYSMAVELANQGQYSEAYDALTEARGLLPDSHPFMNQIDAFMNQLMQYRQ